MSAEHGWFTDTSPCHRRMVFAFALLLVVAGTIVDMMRLGETKSPPSPSYLSEIQLLSWTFGGKVIDDDVSGKGSGKKSNDMHVVVLTSLYQLFHRR